MQGKNISVGQLLGSNSCYQIPVYQRPYQWNSERWQAFASDVFAASQLDAMSPDHWMGILLISKKPDADIPGENSVKNYEVIDGQQRLVTILVWVMAMLDHMNDAGEPSNFSTGDFAEVEVQEVDHLVFRALRSGTWKLPAFGKSQDHQIFQAYLYFRYILWLGNEALAEEQSLRYPMNFPAFENPNIEREQFWHDFHQRNSDASETRTKANVKKLYDTTLNRLKIFSLIHDADIDEEQAIIFDTLNGMRQELEPLDHIRNSIFVRMPNKGHNVFIDHWVPAERSIDSVKKRGLKPGKAFIYDFLIQQGQKKTQGSINASRGSVHFARMTKNFSETKLEKLIEQSVVPAMHCWPVAIGKSNSAKIGNAQFDFSSEIMQRIETIQSLSSGPANPLVLHFLLKYVRDSDETYLGSALQLTESLLARYFLASQPLPLLRSKIMNLMGELQLGYDLDEFKDLLRSEMWPSDQLVTSSFLTNEFGQSGYKPGQLGAIFRGIERQMSGEGSMFFKMGNKASQYSIEHIYPQKPALWSPDLKKWKVDPSLMEDKMHLMGNLTVVTTKHNKAVGNKTFSEKRNYATTIGNAAPMSINLDWLNVDLDKWTPKHVDARNKLLLDAALKYWADI